jgi:hypothetical protein
LYGVLLPIKKAQENTALRWYTLQRWPSFWLLKPASELAHVRILPRLFNC